MSEDEYLMLSGIQHFAFCRRQWALIYIERQWVENDRTVEGQLLHRVAHDTSRVEKRKDVIIVRGLKVQSRRLEVTGVCDVVEFRRSPTGITMHGWDGLWQPYPVEYKKGSPKENDADLLQLCAQAMCLEEMLCCEIPEGSLYYSEVRHRQQVNFSMALRNQVETILQEMKQLYERGWTPKVKPSKACNACSLKEICLPKLSKTLKVDTYLDRYLKEGEQ